MGLRLAFMASVAFASGFLAIVSSSFVALALTFFVVAVAIHFREHRSALFVSGVLLGSSFLLAIVGSLLGGRLPLGLGSITAPLALVGVLLSVKSLKLLGSVAVLWTCIVAASLLQADSTDSVVGIANRVLMPIAALCLLAVGLEGRISRRSWALMPLRAVAFFVSVSLVIWPRHEDLGSRLTANYSRTDGTLRAFGFTENPNEYGLIAAVVIVGLLVCRRLGGEKSAVDVLLILGCSAAIVASSTRSALISLAVGVALLLVQGDVSKARRALGVGLATVLVLVLFFGDVSIGGRPLLGGVGSDGSSTYRADTLRIVTKRLLAGEGSLLGYGVSNGNALNVGAVNAGRPNIDNSFLYVAIAFGSVGLIAFLTFIAAFIVGVISRQRFVLPLAATLAPAFFFENAIASFNLGLALILTAWSIHAARHLYLERAVSASDGEHKPATFGSSSFGVGVDGRLHRDSRLASKAARVAGRRRSSGSAHVECSP